MIRLFSYGTLQQDGVQLALFGRQLRGEADVLTGYRVGTILITDPGVVATSGAETHLVLDPSADPADEVTGVWFEITADELAATDAYETAQYARIEAPLKSGVTAWVYIRA